MARAARIAIGALVVSATGGFGVIASNPATAATPAVSRVPASQTESDAERLPAGSLAIPVGGISRSDLRDTFTAPRQASRHEAIDIAAPVGTPVYAVADGTVVKLFKSERGGLTIYHFDTQRRFAFYYAHLDRYAVALREGAVVQRCDLLGFVGNTGNAPAHAPHLHFAVSRLGADKAWWRGTPVNPYEALVGAPIVSASRPATGPTNPAASGCGRSGVQVRP